MSSRPVPPVENPLRLLKVIPMMTPQNAPIKPRAIASEFVEDDVFVPTAMSPYEKTVPHRIILPPRTNFGQNVRRLILAPPIRQVSHSTDSRSPDTDRVGRRLWDIVGGGWFTELSDILACFAAATPNASLQPIASNEVNERWLLLLKNLESGTLKVFQHSMVSALLKGAGYRPDSSEHQFTMFVKRLIINGEQAFGQLDLNLPRSVAPEMASSSNPRDS